MKSIKIFVVATLLALSTGSAMPASRDIYPDPAEAKVDLASALKTAARTHKRILLDFGGNWCGDCQVLDIYFHNAQNLPLLESNFVLVHVNIGSSQMEENRDIAQRYQIPLELGVPAVAVLSESGKLLYSQKGGEFEKMRHMDPSAVTTFLVQWKPVKQGCSAVMVNC